MIFHYILPLSDHFSHPHSLCFFFPYLLLVLQLCIWTLASTFPSGSSWPIMGILLPLGLHFGLTLTLIVPRAWESSYTQPCKKCQGNRQLILFIFEVVKLSPIHIWKPLHTFHSKVKAFPSEPLSLSTTGCYKNKYTIQFLWMACISRFVTAILSAETELALGTIRVKHVVEIWIYSLYIQNTLRLVHLQSEDIVTYTSCNYWTTCVFYIHKWL